MFAASPQRELKREWDTCVDTVADLIIAQGGTLDQMRQLAIGGCTDEESRLTGAMVREFGYERGSRAVQGTRDLKLGQFERRIAARNNPTRPTNLFERTPEGWDVRRIGPNDCTSTLVTREFPAPTFAILSRTSKQTLIVFGELSSAAAATARRYTGSRRMVMSVYKYVGNSGVSLGQMEFEFEGLSDGFAFSLPLTDDLVGLLSNARAVQFRPSLNGESVPPPRTYHVTGIPGAWQALLRCTG